MATEIAREHSDGTPIASLRLAVACYAWPRMVCDEAESPSTNVIRHRLEQPLRLVRVPSREPALHELLDLERGV